MKRQEKYLRKALINIERYHGKIHNISRVLLSLQDHTNKSEYNSFYDKELDERVHQLITFFNRKYSDVPTCKTDDIAVSEIPIFYSRGS